MLFYIPLLFLGPVLAARVPLLTSTTTPSGRTPLTTTTRAAATPTTTSATSTVAAATTCASPLPTYGCLPLVKQASWTSAILDQHNTYRARHNVPAMTWNADLANKALQNAQANSDANTFAHTANNPYGENIGSMYGYTNPQYLVYLWYNEINSYDYNNPGFSDATGHFTQVVWKDSVQLGCAFVQNQVTGAKNNGYYYIACEYSPAGNVLGNFPSQVLRPNANPAPTAPSYYA